MKYLTFAQLEAFLEQFLEHNLARLFSQRVQLNELAARLARAMEDNSRLENGELIAPNDYIIHLHGDDYQVLAPNSAELIQQLTDVINKAAEQLRCRLHSEPTVQIRIDAMLKLHTFAIVAGHTGSQRHSTKLFAPVEENDEINLNSSQPHNPQMIIQGNRFVSLTQPIINIGRRRDNQIVIDEPKVSRLHAQLRLRFGRYVLYDLGSSGGTFVNDHHISECVLNSGDVISLAGVTMLYLEDDVTTGQHRVQRTNLTDTQPFATAPDPQDI